MKIIATLAVMGYKVDPRGDKLTQLGEIRRDVESLGLSISDDTLRKKLRDALALVPRKT